MSLVPEFQIGFLSAWWFSAIYATIHLVLVAVYPKDFAKRLFGLPHFNSLKERLISLFYFILYFGVMIYSVFLPLKLSTIWFWAGLPIFALGVILSTIAMLDFANTPSDRPVVKGIYRISRNPMQVMAVIAWLGAGIATASWVIIAACVVQCFLLYPSILAQERFCIEKYGEPYQQYMKRAPRYFLFF